MREGSREIGSIPPTDQPLEPLGSKRLQSKKGGGATPFRLRDLDEGYVHSILTPAAMVATMRESRPRVPNVYFSIGEIELLSVSAREMLADYAGDSSAVPSPPPISDPARPDSPADARQHVLRRDAANSPVQTDVVLMLCVTLPTTGLQENSNTAERAAPRSEVA